MTLFLLIGGIAGLLGGAELLIQGSLGLAKRYKVPEFLVGLTILTLGTSTPELLITVTGAMRRLTDFQVSELVVSEIVGSGIGQIGLVLGLSGVFGNLSIEKKELKFQGVFLIGSALLLWFFSRDLFLSRAEGVAMILVYGYYLIHLRNTIPKKAFKSLGRVKHKPVQDFFFTILGLVMIIFSSDMVIVNGVALAEEWHVSASLIGLFLVGLGTSLPELVVSLTAAVRKANGLTVGNIVGSNIFDVLVALGSGVVISGFKVERSIFLIDMPFLLLVSSIVCLFFYTKNRYERKETLLVLSMYFIYVIFKVLSV